MNDLEFFSATKDNTTYFKYQVCTFTLNGCQQTWNIETFVENIKVSFSLYIFFYEWFMLKYWIVKLLHSSCNNTYMDGWIKDWIKSLYVKNYILPGYVIFYSKYYKARVNLHDNLNCCQVSVCSSYICMLFILLSYSFPIVWLLMDFFYDFSYRNKLQRQLFQQFYLYYRIHQTVLFQV